jgi:hypothetical protein
MPDAPPLACRLDALDRDEQARRAALAERVMGLAAEVRETADGYEARLAADPLLARDVTDWLLLERRCCPFLRLELRFEPASEAMWIRFGGGEGVKEFLADAGISPRAAHSPKACC